MHLSQRWMNLESIIQSEVSQKEINRHHMLMYVYGIQKDSIDEPICRAAMEMQPDIETRLVDLGEEEGG